MRAPDGWVEQPIYKGGKKSGLFLIKGSEIHCFRLDSFAGKWLTRQDMEATAKPIFEKYGFLTTSVANKNDDGHKFVTRMGFEKTSMDDTTTYYKCERLNHARF